MTERTRGRIVAVSIATALLLLAPLAIREARALWATRQALACYTRLIAAAAGQDLPTVRRLCTRRFAAERGLQPAPGGGVTGIPQAIRRRYRIWLEPGGREVRLCPLDRYGPVYRFVREDGTWVFDGLAGELTPDGRFEAAEEIDSATAPASAKFPPLQRRNSQVSVGGSSRMRGGSSIGRAQRSQC